MLRKANMSTVRVAEFSLAFRKMPPATQTRPAYKTHTLMKIAGRGHIHRHAPPTRPTN